MLGHSGTTPGVIILNTPRQSFIVRSICDSLSNSFRLCSGEITSISKQNNDKGRSHLLSLVQRKEESQVNMLEP